MFFHSSASFWVTKLPDLNKPHGGFPALCFSFAFYWQAENQMAIGHRRKNCAKKDRTCFNCILLDYDKDKKVALQA